MGGLGWLRDGIDEALSSSEKAVQMLDVSLHFPATYLPVVNGCTLLFVFAHTCLLRPTDGLDRRCSCLHRDELHAWEPYFLLPFSTSSPGESECCGRRSIASLRPECAYATVRKYRKAVVTFVLLSMHSTRGTSRSPRLIHPSWCRWRRMRRRMRMRRRRR